MNNEFEKCQYCKHYNNHRCSRLTADIDFNNIMALITDHILCNRDLNIAAEETLPHVPDVGKRTIDFIEMQPTRMNKEIKSKVKDFVNKIVNEHHEKCIQNAAKLAEDEISCMTYIDMSQFPKSITNIHVEPDFYCKHFE